MANHDALTHTAGQLVGKVAQTLLGSRQTNESEHFDGAVQRLFRDAPR